MHVNVSVISCVSGDRNLAATDSTDSLIQTLLPLIASGRGLKQKDIDFYIWAKNKRVAKEVDSWREAEGEDSEKEEARDLKGDLSHELPKRLAMRGV